MARCLVDLEQNLELGLDVLWRCLYGCSRYENWGDLRWVERVDGLEVRWIKVRPPLPLKADTTRLRNETARM